jgi:FtsH-binding integral membrane protein
MILKILLAIAAVLLVLMVVFRKKIRKITINKPLFILGILLALTDAFLMWNGHILGENTTGIATVIGIVGIGLIATSSVSGKPKKTPMEQETKKENKLMFWIGIVIVAIAVIFFLTAKEEFENKMWIVPIWIMGIGLIAGSRYRFLK